jgi:predicted ATPase
MITSISLENFKSWKEAINVRTAPITGLFGSNSSGKTSLLQLFLMLKQTTESPDRAQVLHLGDDKSLVELGTYGDVVFSHKTEAPLKWNIVWRLDNELKIDDPEHKGTILFKDRNIGFEAKIEGNGSGRVIVREMAYEFALWRFGMKRTAKDKGEYTLFFENLPNALHSEFKFKRMKGRPWELPAPAKCYGFPDQVKAYYQNAGFLADFELAFEELFSRVYYLGPLRDYPKRQYTWAGAQPADMGRRGEKVVEALLASRDREPISRGKGLRRFTLEEYVAWWLKKLGLISNFSVEPIGEGSNLYRVLVQKTPTSAKVIVTDVGFGVSQILPVLTICYYVPEGSTIIMEQPEIHLHPSVQAGLADVFIDAIKTRNVQIILESHSEYLLRRLQRRIAEEKLSSKEATLYFCNMKDGKSRLVELGLDLMGNITNWPQDFFGDQVGEMAAMTRAQMQRKKEGKL